MINLPIISIRPETKSQGSKRSSVPRLLALLPFLCLLLAFAPTLQAQDDNPCDCGQRWEKGAHWNDDGTVDDSPNAPAPLGVVRCGNSAETQSQIVPMGCVYNATAFEIDVSGSPCFDPSTGQMADVENPEEGQPIIWFNFDVRAGVTSFEIQLNDNSGDNIGFALYRSANPQAGIGDNGLSGDCLDLIFVACGKESSNTWNTMPVPDPSQPTNFYLAIWDQDADDDLRVNNFKARRGCEEALECDLDVDDEIVVCNEDGSYTVTIPIEGENGRYIGSDPNATPTTSAAVCLTNEDDGGPTSGEIVMTYPPNANYNITISIDSDDEDDCPDPEDPDDDDCRAVVKGDAPDCCPLDLIECPPNQQVSCGSLLDPGTVGLPFDEGDCTNITAGFTDMLGGGACGEVLTIVRTWKFTDNKGNMTTCDQLIEIVDLVDPVIEDIADFSIMGCDTEWPDLSTEWSDNCAAGGNVEGVPGEVMTEDDGCTEFRIYTFTITDNCGNSASSTTKVTRTPEDLIVECPADFTMAACKSADQIAAAFADFLDDFKVTSGCNASGDFDADYSAPDPCEGGSVTVSFTATADCGQTETCTATFTVPECTTGDCGECPTACRISGDQLVCPLEVTTYTIDIDDACENPTISWSLLDDSDAEIISTSDGGRKVTVKANDDCGGWYELIAKVKCEGCPEVTCKYPVDVVLTEIKLDCPDDVVIDACTSVSDIQDAFEDFLDDFSFSVVNGCGTKGEFAEDYSAPDACGGSVTVKYIVTDNCGSRKTCSATFTVKTCTTGSCALCEGECDISGDQLVCPLEVTTYTLSLDEVCDNPTIVWSLKAGSDGEIVSISADKRKVTVKANDDCGGWYELMATVKCADCPDVVCTYPVDVVLTEIKLDCPDDVVIDACTSVSDIQDAFEDFLDDFSFSVVNGCGTKGEFAEDYSAPDACGGSVTVKYIVTDNCGSRKTCSATFTVKTCTTGSCALCEGECDISGDQLVCPLEVTTYTLSLDEVCDNPTIVWSLKAGSDGEIVSISADKRKVTVKADDDCGGWYELKATVKCADCPDVVCTYPVDVVLTEIKLDCPDDVVIDACTSVSDINKAFEDFLDDFKFSVVNGCGTKGEFAEDYSAPDACGGSVTVKYIVTDNCGSRKTCSATFTVKTCTTGSCALCEGECLISGRDITCPNEMLTYTLSLDEVCGQPTILWSIVGDASIASISADKRTVKVLVDDDCDGWFELKATVKCPDCPDVICKKEVDILRHKLVARCPADKTVEACLSQGAIDAAFSNFLEGFYTTGGCGGRGQLDDDYKAPDRCGGSVTVWYTAVDDCGQRERCSATFTVPKCETGDCQPCDGVCRIKGDGVLCPNEMETYTVELEGKCENPSVWWSIEGDAEIVEKSGNWVKVRADNDCDGWFKLTARISCKDCPDVVCMKTVDVEADKPVVWCPGDYTVPASCKSQYDIDKLFEEFLDKFSFNGDCGTTGGFEEDYQAPDRCGGSVTVWFKATNPCGTDRCSATFTVPKCETGDCAPCDGVCRIKGDNTLCPNEMATYTVELEGKCEYPTVWWSIEGDAEIVEKSGNWVKVRADNDCDGWFKLTARISCKDCPDVVCMKTVDVEADKPVVWCPSDYTVPASCKSQYDIDKLFEEFLDKFSFNGDCGTTGGFEEDYQAPDRCGGSVTVWFKATNACGTDRCSATFTVPECKTGDCAPCDASCRITGDDSVCPDDLLTYSVELDGNCSYPSVHWTLEGDAVIKEQSGRTVKVLVDKDCEGSFKLTATIKCEGCPDVVCMKTVKIAGEEVKAICPPDFTVPATCKSQAEIDELFKQFLAKFTYSGNCGASGQFEADYKAPDECGGSVTVWYRARNSCSTDRCSARFIVPDAPDLIVECPGDVQLPVCTPQSEVNDKFEDFLEEFKNSFAGGCDAKGSFDAQYSAPDECGGSVMVSYTIRSDCEEPRKCKATFSVKPDNEAPMVPDQSIPPVDCIDDVPTPGDLIELLELVVRDNCDDDPSIQIISDTGKPECKNGTFSRVFEVKLCDDCGNCKTIEIGYTGNCTGDGPGEGATYCTLTQGGWGNAGGKYPWKNDTKATTLEIITALMNANGDIVVGDPMGNSLTIEDPACVIALLPGGGMPGVLPAGDATANNGNDCKPYSDDHLTNGGRLKNNLATQAIALQLNIWYSAAVPGNDLGALTLVSLGCPADDLPASVETVQDLLNYANRFLSGKIGSNSGLAGELTELLSKVNQFFDGCREFGFDPCDEPGKPGDECEGLCSLTQGGWGNAGGKYPWDNDAGKATTTDILNHLLGKYGDVMLGDPMYNSLFIKSSACVLELLPGTGKPGPLPNGDAVANTGSCDPYGEKLNNLATQAVALQLNIWYSWEVNGANLGGLSLHADCLDDDDFKGIPMYVMLVQDLLDYANVYLSGQLGSDKDLAGTITEALASVNEAFGDCRIDSDDLLEGENEIDELRIQPNPASSFVRLDYRAYTAGPVNLRILDANGRVAFGETYEAIVGDNTWSIPIQGFPAGMYVIITQHGETQLQQRLVIAQ